MSLRAELDAAYRKIAALEKELARYRGAAATKGWAKSKSESESESKECEATTDGQSASKCTSGMSRMAAPATRSRSKAMARRMELKATSARGGDWIKKESEGMDTSGELATGMSKTRKDKGGVTIRPTPQPTNNNNNINTPIIANTFVPLKLNLPTNAFATTPTAATPSSTAQCLVAAKVTSGNILSASSALAPITTTIPITPSSPTMSTNNINMNMNKSHSKRHSSSSNNNINNNNNTPSPVLQSGISKLSRKERSGGLVAKCTEPRPGQTRYWTEEEHERFLEAVAQYGEKAYVAISNYVETRTPKQVRTHAQKFQMKVARLAKERAECGECMELPAGMLPSSIGIDPSKVSYTPPLNATPLQVEAAARAASENEARRRAKREAEQQASAAIVPIVPMATSTSNGCVLVVHNNNNNMNINSQHQHRSSTSEHSNMSNMSNMSDMSNMSNMSQPMLTETISQVSDVTNEDLSDPYLNYIGGDSNINIMRDDQGLGELDECFAARLPKSWEIGKDHHLMEDVKAKLPAGLLSATGRDDDLEDLEDCGDLSMASLINFGI